MNIIKTVRLNLSWNPCQAQPTTNTEHNRKQQQPRGPKTFKFEVFPKDLKTRSFGKISNLKVFGPPSLFFKI